MNYLIKAGFLAVGICCTGIVTADSTIARLDSLLLASTTTLNGKKAISVYLGGDQENYCDITFTADYLRESQGQMVNIKRDQPDLDASCTWIGEDFVISSMHSTRISFNLVATENGTGQALLTITGNLFGSKNNYLRLLSPNPIPFDVADIKK